jgi:hypothetical protein
MAWEVRTSRRAFSLAARIPADYEIIHTWGIKNLHKKRDYFIILFFCGPFSGIPYPDRFLGHVTGVFIGNRFFLNILQDA